MSSTLPVFSFILAAILFLILPSVLASQGFYHSDLDEHHHQAKDSILFRDIEVLTLHEGQSTRARRVSPIPQLKCVGGSARTSYNLHPKTVQCKNVGWDGRQVQWKCEAQLNSQVQFGKLQVSCEGYKSSKDPFVLIGSCGLEYELDYKPGAASRASREARAHTSAPPVPVVNPVTPTTTPNTASDITAANREFFTVAIVAIIILAVITSNFVLQIPHVSPNVILSRNETTTETTTTSTSASPRPSTTIHHHHHRHVDSYYPAIPVVPPISVITPSPIIVAQTQSSQTPLSVPPIEPPIAVTETSVGYAGSTTRGEDDGWSSSIWRSVNTAMDWSKSSDRQSASDQEDSSSDDDDIGSSSFGYGGSSTR